LKDYFNGVKPAGSRDFITNTANQGALVYGLVKFFGTTLGCTDNSIDQYGADEAQPDMKAIHEPMGIEQSEFDLFNTVLIGELKNVGGMGKGLSEGTANKVHVFLNATAPDVCAKCGEFQARSLCEKWHGGKNALLFGTVST
jgi:hypothetical protein